MNKIVKTFLLAGDKFMPQMHLKQPGFTYSTCGFDKAWTDKACCQHDMAYGDFKDLKRRTASDKILRDKTFDIAKNPKYDEYQKWIASMVYKFFDKKSAVIGVNIPFEFNEQLAKELHKPISWYAINKQV